MKAKFVIILITMFICSCSSKAYDNPAKSSNRSNKSVYEKSNSTPYHPKYSKYKSYDQYKK